MTPNRRHTRPPDPRPHGAAGAGGPAPGGHASLGGDLRGRQRQPRRARSPPPADFNTVAVVLTDPGTPLRGSVPVTATAASDRGITSVVFSTAPAGTGTWTVGLHEDRRALHLHLRHDDGRRRAARRARRRDRQRRLHAHLDGHQPPRRQHRADRDDDRPRLAADRHRHRRRHRRRRRLRPRERGPRVPLDHRRLDRRSARRPPRRSPAPGTPRRSPTGSTTCARSPPTVAGNQTISAPVYNRRVDNTAPTATMTDPGTPLRGTITLASTTGDGNGSGVSSVRYEYKLGTGALGATRLHQRRDPVLVHVQHGHRRVADGLYDFRASPPTASPRSRPRPRSPRAASTTPPRPPSRSTPSPRRCRTRSP